MWYVLIFIVILVCLSKSSEQRDFFTNEASLKPPSYVQREYVGLKEPRNEREKCPTYYEEINQQILREHLTISESAYGYTPNRYLDITRFVDYGKLSEPLPVNPDFFMTYSK